LGNPNPEASNLALAVVLLVVVFFQAAFNAWQDFSTSRVMDSIKGMLPADVVVLRDGVQTSLPAASLVPGDIVHLVMGQKVPADVKLIDVSGDLRFDRSVLTGEVSHDSRAYTARPFLFLFSANDSPSYVERTDRRTLRQDE
jgi:sodium/potassium-transporting ATPase subunit alpha